jgi:hypothetical protein
VILSRSEPVASVDTAAGALPAGCEGLRCTCDDNPPQRVVYTKNGQHMAACRIEDASALPRRGSVVDLPRNVVGEVVAALRTALGDEPPVGAARVGATELAGVRVGTNLIIDTAIGEVEPRPVGSSCPYLPHFARTVKRRVVAAIGNGGCVLKHAHRQFGVDYAPAYLGTAPISATLDGTAAQRLMLKAHCDLGVRDVHTPVSGPSVSRLPIGEIPCSLGVSSDTLLAPPTTEFRHRVVP